MKPTDPEGLPGQRVDYAASQDQYETLLSNRVSDAEGKVWSRWELSADERRAILDGACIELAMWTFGAPLQPVYLRVQGVEEAAVMEKRMR